MKKQTVSLLALLLAVSGFFFSCGNMMNKNAGALEFDSIQVNETVHLFGDSAKPACNLIINFTYANKSSEKKFKDSINTYFLSSCFGDKYITMTPQQAVKSYTEKYISDYRKDLEPMYEKDAQDKQDDASMESWYSYYKSIDGYVQLYYKHLLVYAVNYSEYTGGAHGITTASYLNMDLRTLAPIRLEDIFVEDYKEPLTDLLWNQLMADNKVTTRQELEDMGYASTGELTPTENFYLSKEGITFYYNVYDIAPYVMGSVAISLPYEIMQNLLSNDCMPLNEIRNK